MTSRLLLVGALLGPWGVSPALGQPAPDADADVTVELKQFGIGNSFRPGELTAIRVTLTSALDEAVQVWVQWEVPNAEGDIAEYGRSVTLSPGVPAPVWLYAPLPANADRQKIWSVRVFEERDGRRRGELGGWRISPADVSAFAHELDKGMIAVVGRAAMHLDDYLTKQPWNRPNPAGAHEETRVISGVSPDELPDRWEGLKCFEAVAWSDARPQLLRVDAAEALREYVRRGGHLIIALPEAGNDWGLGAPGQTWLSDLLPQRAPRSDEGVLLSELMPLLSKSDRVLRDFELTIRVFKDLDGVFDVIDNGYEPFMALPDGRVVVIQRLYGFGRITILGVDLSSGQLSSQRLPHADAFWNRVLGRRSDTPFPDELTAMDAAQPRGLARGRANEVTIADSRLFENTINKSGRAELGLLGALVLFVAYFIVAGPPGFLMLKHRGWTRHAWLGFAAAAGIFTAIAWGGVRVLREHSIELWHVSFLDHVYRPSPDLVAGEPQFQRSVFWGSLYLPSYGTAEVSLDSDPQRRDVLSTWFAPEKGPERFPNVDRYAIDVGRSPARYEIPVRATATQLYANWLGSLDPDDETWRGMLRVAEPVKVAREHSGQPELSGKLVHDFPMPLRDVRIFWISGQRGPRPRYQRDGNRELPWTPPPIDQGRRMLNAGRSWKLGEWPGGNGNAVDLSALDYTAKSSLDRNIYRELVEKMESESFGVPGMGRPRWDPNDHARQFMDMLSIYHQLTPPKYHRQDNKDPESAVLTRKLGRELDLSAWFTRPCLIVIGSLEDAPTPVPLEVDGKRPDSIGLTVVRWIYPLPLGDLDRLKAEGETP